MQQDLGIVAECRICHKKHVLLVTHDQLRRWRSGELIQNAMPNLSAAERELLISGTCGKCFDAMFKRKD